MFNWFDYGVLGGLFGKPLSQWLRRFRLWILFVFVVIATHIGLFVEDGWYNGWLPAMHRSMKFAITPVGFFVPVGIGFAAIFIVLIGAPNKRSKNEDKGHA